MAEISGEIATVSPNREIATEVLSVSSVIRIDGGWIAEMEVGMEEVVIVYQHFSLKKRRGSRNVIDVIRRIMTFPIMFPVLRVSILFYLNQLIWFHRFQKCIYSVVLYFSFRAKTEASTRTSNCKGSCQSAGRHRTEFSYFWRSKTEGRKESRQN